MDKKLKEKQFRALYAQYYAPFCLFARHFIDNPTICEDLVSDVFVNMWGRIDTIDLDSPTVSAYIKMCVRNACLNHIRHNMHKENFEQESRFAELIYEDNTDRVYSLDELYRMLYEVLESLPESHRQVFIKTYVEGKSREEIASELDISVKSVGRYKQKTLELLRSELSDFLPVVMLLLSCSHFNSV